MEPCCSSRRSFLAGLATLSAGALLSKDELAAQTRPAAPHRIDVHAHFVSPGYVAVLKPKGLIQGRIAEWSAAEMIETLRREATSFCNGAFDDDLTLVVVTVK